MCTEVLTVNFIIMEFENIGTKVSITLSIIIKFIVYPTQMINIACQNVTEGTDSFDFCEVSLNNQSFGNRGALETAACFLERRPCAAFLLPVTKSSIKSASWEFDGQKSNISK